MHVSPTPTVGQDGRCASSPTTTTRAVSLSRAVRAQQLDLAIALPAGSRPRLQHLVGVEVAGAATGTRAGAFAVPPRVAVPLRRWSRWKCAGGAASVDRPKKLEPHRCRRRGHRDGSTDWIPAGHLRADLDLGAHRK